MSTNQTASSRRNRTNIVRTRTGCLTCRRRRLKCDETRPSCRACQRLSVPCPGYHRPLTFRDDSAFIEQKVTNDRAKRTRTRKDSRNESQIDDSTPIAYQNPDITDDENAVENFDVETRNHECPSNERAFTESREPFLNCSPDTNNRADLNTLIAIMTEPSVPASRRQSCSASPETELPLIANEPKQVDRNYEDTTIPSMYPPSPDPTTPRTIQSHGPNFLNSGEDAALTDSIAVYGHVASESNLSFGVTPSQCLDSSEAPEELWFEEEYMNYWQDELSSRLPAVFIDIQKAYSNHPALRKVFLALAAADIAITQRRTSQRNGTNQGSGQGNVYYGMSLREFAQRGPYSYYRARPVLKLALLMLFAWFELMGGTWVGAIQHMIHLDDVVSVDIDQIRMTNLGCHLLCAWRALRAQFCASCSPFGSQDFALALQHTTTMEVINQIIQNHANDYQSLLPLFCEAQRLSVLVLLERTVGFDASNRSYTLWSESLAKINKEPSKRTLYVGGSEYHHLKELERLQEKLDSWHANVTLDSLPIERFDSRSSRMNRTHRSGLDVHPLLFQSHQKALNYAIYACTHLLCSRDQLDYCTNALRSEEGTFNPWAMLFLRIVAGIDLSTCLKQNTFQVGILQMLTQVLLRCHNREMATWIHHRICELSESDYLQESSIPIRITKLLSAQLKQQMEARRPIFFVLTSLGAELERSLVLDGNIPVTSLFHGHDLATGELFFEFFPVIDV